MRNLPPEIRINKKAQFNLRDFLGVDFTTHESEVNFRRSPDAVNLVSGQTGSIDKRLGYAIEHIFDGKIYAIKNIKTFVYGTTVMPDGIKERFEIEVIVVHAGTKLWAYNSHLDTWQQAKVWDGVNPYYNAVLQERETNFIEYSNQSYMTLIHNNWINNKNDLLVLYCAGSTYVGEEGTIWFYIYLNDSVSINLYYPTTSIGRSPNGLTTTPYERPNGLVNARINKFLSNGTDKTFVLDYNGSTYSMGAYGGLVTQMLADGSFGQPHDASNNPITWTYDNANHSITFSAVPHATYKAGVDNIEVRFYTDESTKKVTNVMNNYLSFANYGFKGLNDLIFFCNNTEMRFRNKEIWISSKSQNEGESAIRLYYDTDHYSNLGSNRKIGYSKVGEYLVLHGEREGNSPVAYLKQANIDDIGELIVTNTPTTSQIGALAPKSFDNLRDDPIFLSEAGITAVLIDRITSVQTMQDRGFYINSKLLAEPNISKAVSFIYDNKYFICVNSNVYIADPRMKFNEKLSYSESYQYDWYYWEGLDIQCTEQFLDGLYFGTTDGRLCRFKKETDQHAYEDEIIGTDTVWTDLTSYSKGDIVSDSTKYYICLKPHTSDSVMRNTSNTTYWNEITKGTGVYYVPVLAYWTTPIMNMGDMTSLKTLKNLWVRLGKYANMSARIYYSTQGIVSEKYDGIFDFSNIDFSRFTFSTDTDPSVLVTNRQERKFMSIQFKIESRDSYPFSLLEIVGEFILNGKYKG